MKEAAEGMLKSWPHTRDVLRRSGGPSLCKWGLRTIGPEVSYSLYLAYESVSDLPLLSFQDIFHAAQIPRSHTNSRRLQLFYKMFLSTWPVLHNS